MLQRVRQFRDAKYRPSSAQLSLADRYLEGALLELFRAQHPRDIVHSANTAQWLLDRGHDERELVIAALLHDLGKGQQRRMDRVVWVVAQWFRLGSRLANGRSRLEWRRAMARAAAHSEAGARILLRSGAPERAVTLARLHHSPPRGDRMLALLQQADAAN